MRTGSLNEAQTKKALNYILGMEDTFLKKDNLAGRQYSLKRKPESVEDYRRMEAHPRPPKAVFSTVKELYDIYKREYLGKTIRTISGHTMTFKPGHFFRLIAGTPKDGVKGWIAKAKNSEDAIRMIEAGEIEFSDIAGYQKQRGENIMLFKDVLADGDFYFEESGDRIVFGKKYDRLNKADGFIGITLEIDTKGNLGPLSFHPRRFTNELLQGKNIQWSIGDIGSASPNDATGESAEKTSGFALGNIPQNPDNSSPETEKNGKIFSLKKRQQVNPIREPGPIRDEYQDRLDNSTYATRSNAEVNRLAARRIANLGGMAEAARMVADGELAGNTPVGVRTMQLVLNSPEVKTMDVDERARISDRYEKAGTETGWVLQAGRLNAWRHHPGVFWRKTAKNLPAGLFFCPCRAIF